MKFGNYLVGQSCRLPGKTTMNLARRKKEFHPRTMVPLLAVLIAGFLAAAKFAFLDPLGRKAAAYDKLSRQQEQLASVTASMKNYDQIAAQYGRYSYGYMTKEEAALVDRMQVLSLVESKLAGTATVKDFSVSGNTLSVNIRNVTLAQTSAIVKDLESSDLVSGVSVYTAATEKTGAAAERDASHPADVSMTVTLTKTKGAAK